MSKQSWSEWRAVPVRRGMRRAFSSFRWFPPSRPSPRPMQTSEDMVPPDGAQGGRRTPQRQHTDQEGPEQTREVEAVLVAAGPKGASTDDPPQPRRCSCVCVVRVAFRQTTRNLPPVAQPLTGAPPGSAAAGRGEALEEVVRRQGRGVIENKHSTDVGSPPPTPRACLRMGNRPGGTSCSDLGWSAWCQRPSCQVPTEAEAAARQSEKTSSA